jgi:hypothetical protein
VDTLFRNRLVTAPVTVGWYLHPLEAEIARGLLESEGIPAFLHSCQHSLLNWPMTLALGGVRLQVPPSAVGQALEVLSASVSSESSSEAEFHMGRNEEDWEWRTLSWKLALVAIHFLNVPLPFSTAPKHHSPLPNETYPE